jgi:acetyl-CoA acetyltransferase family protein
VEKKGVSMSTTQLADNEPVIVDAVRTPVGRRKGALQNWHAAELLAEPFKALLERTGVPAAHVSDVVAGCATQVGEQAGNVARTALLMAGVPFTVPGMTVSRACGSSQQAVHVADNMISRGVCDIVIAGGVELMSHTAGGNDDTRYGRRYPQELVERFSMPSMGIAAERIAARWNLDRSWLDEIAQRSHQLATAAQDGGRFESQMIPIKGEDGSFLQADEGVRRNSSIEKLASLQPAFNESGRVTAGNSSQVSDGAAAMMIMTAAKAREYGLRPRARIKAQLVVGVDPEIMLTGPIPATTQILERANLKLSDIDLFEINEAFASVLGAWLAELNPDINKVNVNGGSIAMGHPLGSTGVRLMTTMLYELERRGGRYGLQAMCCGGGLGTATIIERLD